MVKLSIFFWNRHSIHTSKKNRIPHAFRIESNFSDTIGHLIDGTQKKTKKREEKKNERKTVYFSLNIDATMLSLVLFRVSVEFFHNCAILLHWKKSRFEKRFNLKKRKKKM